MNNVENMRMMKILICKFNVSADGVAVVEPMGKGRGRGRGNNRRGLKAR